jgi:hypothetical protein
MVPDYEAGIGVRLFQLAYKGELINMRKWLLIDN